MSSPAVAARVALGTTLVVGQRYRITEIAVQDNSPAHKVGDVVQCVNVRETAAKGIGLYPNWRADSCWFAGIDRAPHGSYITGLELVPSPPSLEERVADLESRVIADVGPEAMQKARLVEAPIPVPYGMMGVAADEHAIKMALPASPFRAWRALERLVAHACKVRDGGSWSHVVGDDGKCKREDLASIAEINGYNLLDAKATKGERIETLRGRARVLGCTFEPPLPPAESCAHAVARFRSELEALCSRHSVEVEVGHIESGSYDGGIVDVVPAVDDSAQRERKALDKIEAWCLDTPDTVKRSSEFRYVTPPRGPRRPVIILGERSGNVNRVREGVHSLTCESKTFRGLTRLEVFEATAAWCEREMGK